MFYDAVRNDHGFAADPFKALVVPRPIAWISTVSAEGINNLSPYSFFNAFSEDPFYLAFGSGGQKDTLRNIEETGVFAVNLATYDLREAMNTTSAVVASAIDEFHLAGLPVAPCHMIVAPRIANSPVTFECRHFQTLPLPDDEGQTHNFMVLGRVLGIHIDDRYIENGRVNTAAMKPIARLGYSEYATIENAWKMRRPG